MPHIESNIWERLVSTGSNTDPTVMRWGMLGKRAVTTWQRRGISHDGLEAFSLAATKVTPVGTLSGLRILFPTISATLRQGFLVDDEQRLLTAEYELNLNEDKIVRAKGMKLSPRIVPSESPTIDDLSFEFEVVEPEVAAQNVKEILDRAVFEF